MLAGTTDTVHVGGGKMPPLCTHISRAFASTGSSHIFHL